MMYLSGVKPIQSGVKTVGLQFMTVPEHSILAEIGIKNNDILTGINEFEIKSLSTLLALTRLFKQENIFTLKIIREGKTQTYNIIFK